MGVASSFRGHEVGALLAGGGTLQHNPAHGSPHTRLADVGGGDLI